jgi:hypothetical protein
MKGINIMSGIMVPHEVLHETKRSNISGIILKYFEKAYDKICWSFLLESEKSGASARNGVNG